MADRFWVAGTGNYSDNTNHWAATSGGSPGATLPSTSDNVFFDSASAAASYVVTMDAGTKACADITITAPATGNMTLAGSTAMTVAGSLTFYAGLVLTYTGVITFSATSGTKILTTAGVVLSSNLIFDGVGGQFKFGDFVTTTGTTTLTNGSLVNSNTGLLFTASFSSSNTNIRGIGGIFGLTGSGTVWNCATSTNLTVDAATAVIAIINTGSSARTIMGGGKRYAVLQNLDVGTATVNIGDTGNTFDFWEEDNNSTNHSWLFLAGSTTTFGGVVGFANNKVTIGSIGGAATHTLVKTGGGLMNMHLAQVSFSIASPASTWYAGAVAVNGGNNTNWIFNIPGGAGRMMLLGVGA